MAVANYPGEISKNAEMTYAANGRAEVRQTQISEQCTDLTDKTETLLKMLSELEQRLERILRPQENILVKGEDERPMMKPEPLAPLADFLHGRNGMLQTALGRLNNILLRLEL